MMSRRNLSVLLYLVVAISWGCAPPPAPLLPPSPPEPPVTPAPPVVFAPMESATWEDLPGWPGDGLGRALEAFNAGCKALSRRAGWGEVCADAARIDPSDAEGVRLFFEDRFQPFRARQPDGSYTGTLTGYYVPELDGSRQRTERFKNPLYRVPDDMLVVDLRSIYPELGDYRLRGRVEGRKVVPYWKRSEINGEKRPLAGYEMLWVEDPVELFFLQVQGSGRIRLPDGEMVMVHYADQNGHPYRSIGKLLLDRGAMQRNQMSMQNIKAWALKNPGEVAQLLGENPSYIFFEELDPGVVTPPGALGVPLTPGSSMAVDSRYVPLGAPVFIDTNWPASSEPMRRLMVAQDTGGAIKGVVRGDFFWGVGSEAGAQAGRMKQDVSYWVLLPRGMAPPAPPATR